MRPRKEERHTGSRMNEGYRETRVYWEKLYQSAMTEPNDRLRRQRVQEAEHALLERAKFLDEQPGDHESEGQALEQAADCLRELKLKRLSDA
jgi:hypothetical protein